MVTCTLSEKACAYRSRDASTRVGDGYVIQQPWQERPPIAFDALQGGADGLFLQRTVCRTRYLTPRSTVGPLTISQIHGIIVNVHVNVHTSGKGVTCAIQTYDQRCGSTSWRFASDGVTGRQRQE